MSDRRGEDWTMFFDDEADEGPCLWQIRRGFPANFRSEEFPASVVIEYAYADAGRPTADHLAELHEFERNIESLDDANAGSLLVHIIRGDGTSEHCYYCRSYESFIDNLNQQLQGKRRYPIEVEWQHDPDWTYWREIKAELDTNGA